jgi:hypothetical protein
LEEVTKSSFQNGIPNFDESLLSGIPLLFASAKENAQTIGNIR